jgi:hypothetical protein
MLQLICLGNSALYVQAGVHGFDPNSVLKSRARVESTKHLGPPLFNKIWGLGWLLGFKGLELGLFLRRVDLLHHLGLLVV